MKSEWHRYNLKRRVAQLPPLDEETFNTKVMALSTTEEAPKKKEKQITKKEQRRKEKEALQQQKRDLLEQAKRAMMEKIKNGEIPAFKEDDKLEKGEDASDEVENEKEPEVPVNEEPAESQEQEKPEEELTTEELEERLIKLKLANKIEIKPTTCLFAHPKQNHNFDTIEENIEHMFKSHGLYIPETTYLVDKEGLINYLAEKIGFGFCISCNYQGKNAEAAREHMGTKRHMRIPYETEDEKLEISEFYDFSSTYEDYRNQNVVAAEDTQNDEGDEDWEDVDDDEDVDSQDEDDEDDDELPPTKDAIYQHGHELYLPSGTVLGHRSMARYYRQNLAPERILSEGQGTVIAAETRHMLTIKDRQELATKKRAWGHQKKREDVNDRRAAKFINNQPHFRDPLLQ
ncbi:uncharacterized protein CANTADRAFT_25266 [Suhomyces tanzawaensis NRRL Y-17324]|uniref:ZN622/Rei1/Reh1 zinc finger C2H2-type domain-containing protein n=1 Tax=Suhomyces tanzawaensis NRRL Y-17324 TaxID=984487 RepID=A0A1E4SN28_9ASCO|nr:uncharacterized protein CANTADRAFT_25266 [Suhomyces tanzawaensis NRRL Y-17324]ODV80934.1 hypothetical protein CANTADRAFT_25266 [Suhomyces tanzawaensis NRRL Y-17324]